MEPTSFPSFCLHTSNQRNGRFNIAGIRILHNFAIIRQVDRELFHKGHHFNENRCGQIR